MSKGVKIFAIVVGIIAVLIFVFSHLGGSSAGDTSLTTTATPANTALPGGGGAIAQADSASDFTSLLSRISSINLDTSLFSNAGYLALRNNPVNLGTAIIGRQNPFAPIGTDTAVSQQQGTLSVQTLAPGKVVATSAEFGALITASNLSPTTVVFQYGTSDAFGSTSAPVAVSKNGTALATVANLTPGTTYYVAAVAVQGSNTITGNIMSFTTPAGH
ncbi:MAG TPA: fibronectin type III domain-containing protein [Candidatus Paceibacterota bacterium]|jgi:hypothetical protein|nr:fibronectin type III domain-containing protein [Candidatus Paceibacterota bacterium]